MVTPNGHPPFRYFSIGARVCRANRSVNPTWATGPTVYPDTVFPRPSSSPACFEFPGLRGGLTPPHRPGCHTATAAGLFHWRAYQRHPTTSTSLPVLRLSRSCTLTCSCHHEDRHPTLSPVSKPRPRYGDGHSDQQAACAAPYSETNKSDQSRTVSAIEGCSARRQYLDAQWVGTYYHSSSAGWHPSTPSYVTYLRAVLGTTQSGPEHSGQLITPPRRKKRRGTPIRRRERPSAETDTGIARRSPRRKKKGAPGKDRAGFEPAGRWATSRFQGERVKPGSAIDP